MWIRTGGMYVNEHTILARYPLDLRLKDLVVGFDPTTSGDDHRAPALLATKPALPGREKLQVKFSCSNFDNFHMNFV